MTVIDFFTRPYPGQLSQFLPEKIRENTRKVVRPVSHLLHEARPFLRLLPAGGKRLLERFADHVLHAPLLILESSAEDYRPR